MRGSIIVTLVLGARLAHADHAHTVEHGDASAFGAGVAMVAASFDTMLYVGNYQGVVPSATWSNERFGAGLSAALYRLERNGAHHYGVGDLVAHGQATLVANERGKAGVTAAVSAPIGHDRRGMGMGHPMLMPALFGMATVRRFAVSATAGYSRAIGGDATHDHGPEPIVEPMNPSELTWSAAGDVSFTPKVHGGVRFSGGVPVGLDGVNRVVGAVRVGWSPGRLSTAAELQVGLAGDPFTVRGVVSTAWSFE